MNVRVIFMYLLVGFSASVAAGESASSPAAPASAAAVSTQAVAPAGAASQQGAVVPSPDVILQNGITSLTQKIKQGGSQEELLAFINKEIVRYFDFDYMARLAAGYYWSALNDAQRHVFTERFQAAFFQALARQVSNLGNPQIQFFPPRPGVVPNEVTVSARVVQPQGMPVLMDFRFYHGDQGWKVFDVVADGSSAVLYYRHYYADLASRYGIENLLSTK